MNSTDLGMSLDDMITKRHGEKREQRKEKPAGSQARGSGKAQRQQAPREERQRNGHDDRSRPAHYDSRAAFAEQAAANPRKRVFVSGIGKMSADTLKEVFSSSGFEVVNVTVQRGTGTVSFARYEQAEKAVKDYDRALVDGQEIRVKPFQSEESREQSRPAQTKVQMFGSATRQDERPSEGQIVVKKASSNIRVNNLPYDVKDDELIGIFRECGRILQASTQRGSGTVEFQSVDGAKRAIKEFDGAEVNGRMIEVSYAK
jgi:RNA recognition motif-containing protein